MPRQQHGRGAIIVESIAPDFVFQQPSKPTAWLLEFEQISDTYLNEDGIPKRPTPWRTSAVSYAATSTLVASASIPAAIWVTRRALARRRTFAHELRRLEKSSKFFHPNPARDRRLCQGNLRHRKQEATRQLEMLKSLVAEVVKADKQCPWVARRGSSRRLEVCSSKLAEPVVKIKRAIEELSVIIDVERLISNLESCGGRGDGGEDAEGISSEDDSGLTESDCDDADSDERGGGGGGGAARQPYQPLSKPQPARLYTRAKALLEIRSNNEGGRAIRTRCIFPVEMKGCCETLAEREQQATDRVILHLQRWDLEMVDAALKQLCLLELPDRVKGFKKKRDAVRSKLWRLQEELRVRK